MPGQVLAEFVCPGHPLLDATIDLLMERHRDLLRRGAVLVDATDPGTDPRVLVMLEHTITDARTLSDGRPQITSRRMAFVELRPDGSSTPAGPAPYLDYAPATDEEIAAVADALQASWLTGGLEDRAVCYAIADLAREHLDEVRTRTEERVAKTVAAVRSRLTHEIAYWDRRADEAAAKEQAGKSPGELNSTRWRQRANDLSERLERRLAELELERRVTSLAPVVVGGALVIPAGMLVAAGVRQPPEHSADPAARTRVEQLAMDAVMAAERAMGHEPIGRLARQRRLRHPVANAGRAALRRGQGSGRGRDDRHRHPERDPDLPQRAGEVLARRRRGPRRRCRARRRISSRRSATACRSRPPRSTSRSGTCCPPRQSST